MRSYLSLIPISAKVRRRQNRMTILCIVIAVFLVTTIFSMIEMLLKMEMNNMIDKHGYWHISIRELSEAEAGQISADPGVKAIAWCDKIGEDVLEDYSIDGKKAVVYGVDEAWMDDIWDCIKEGTYPQNDGEIILSASAKADLGVSIGDTITVNTPSGKMDYTISGFGEHDLQFDKLYDTVTVYMTQVSFSELCELNGREVSPTYYVRFRSNNSVTKQIAKIKERFALSDEVIDENTGLLAITGYSSNTYVQMWYPVAAILFVLILVAGVLMISSSMNSNVMQRTRFFGMMRCIGMSRQQVIRFVRLEALSWCKTAVPLGLLLGIAATWILCAGLRYGVGGELAQLPLLCLGKAGILFGIAVGLLTVLIAAQSPAKRAAKVSPVTAASGNTDNPKKIHRVSFWGTVKVETVLGMSHAISARKNLLLMTGSFVLSIMLFLSFWAGLDFVKVLLPSTRPWQPDFTIISSDGSCSVDKGLTARLSEISGVRRVYGNMAALDVPVTSEKNIEEVTIVSYDEYMFRCAKDIQVSGDFSKVSGNCDYVLTIYNTRSPLEEGDKVQVNGTELEVAGVVSEGLFENAVTLICTEETFERLLGKSDYAILSIQLNRDAGEEEIDAIRSLMDDSWRLSDYREIKRDTLAEYWAFRLIVYAFLAIIVLIAALNIINSTSMSVAARTKQYGAMRAVGMDGPQLTRMIAAEVFTYAVSGCIIGCTLGLPLNRLIYERCITAYFGIVWHAPIGILIIILLTVFASAAAAVYTPAKLLCSMAVTETINEL